MYHFFSITAVLALFWGFVSSFPVDDIVLVVVVVLILVGVHFTVLSEWLLVFVSWLKGKLAAFSCSSCLFFHCGQFSIWFIAYNHTKKIFSCIVKCHWPSSYWIIFVSCFAPLISQALVIQHLLLLQWRTLLASFP
jgi:hypothetical protein